MDHLRKVQSGQKLEIPAATFNSFVDAARDFQDRQRDRRSKPEPYFPDSGIILVANNSGADRNRFDVLGVTEPIIPPGSNLIEFKRRPTFRGVKPTAAHKCRFVILLEPVKANKIAHAVIAGVTVARIRIDDPLDTCCDVEPNVCDYLQTCIDGSAQILWKQKNSGVCWAIVRLGNCCEMDESSSSSSWSESSSLSDSSSSSDSSSESSSESPSESSSSPSESSSSESSISESESEESSSSDQSSSASESPSESESDSCCGCRGVTATVRVLIPTPYRSGDDLCFPMADLEFVDGCYQGMSPAGVSCHYICCDESSDSSSDESSSDQSSDTSGSSSPDDSASASESQSPSGGESSNEDSSSEASESGSSSSGESSSEDSSSDSSSDDSSSGSASESSADSSVSDDSSSSFRSDDASSDDSWSDSDPQSGNGNSSSDGSLPDDSSSSWSGW